jgi:hypothetical protein
VVYVVEGAVIIAVLLAGRLRRGEER